MKDKSPLYFSNEVLGYPLLFVMMMWVVFWFESRFGINFNQFGIYPRTIPGLAGIFFSPFIHGSLQHLFNNSIPLLVLSMALFYFYRNIRWKVLLYGLILTGLATWIIGRPSLHIGASGVVYMLVSFLFFKGIFSKQYQLTALALIVVFLYGGMLWYLFPVDPKISWEGHLSGFFVGLLFAVIFKGIPLQNRKFEWEKEGFVEENDPFLRQFDDNGYFIGDQKEPLEQPIKEENVPEIKVVYTFKEKTEGPN